VKVLCWNVNGMKALQRFENGIVLRNLVEEESPHFLVRFPLLGRFDLLNC